MNKSQRQSLQDRHDSNLSAIKSPKEPCLKKHIREGLNAGLEFKLAPTRAIKARAKEKSWDRWNDHMGLHEIFEPRSSFKRELASYKKEKAKYDKAISEYNKAAKPILDQADLDPKANAYELNILLTAAAKHAGLIK